MGDAGDGGDFLGCVGGAALRRLRQADGGRLGMMDVAVERQGEQFGELAGIDLAGRAVDSDELGARGEEFRCIGLVDRDMRAGGDNR